MIVKNSNIDNILKEKYSHITQLLKNNLWNRHAIVRVDSVTFSEMTIKFLC